MPDKNPGWRERDASKRDAPPPAQPGKLRLFFALAFGTILAMRMARHFLPAGFPPLLLYGIALGAPLAAILLAWMLHRGVFHGLIYGESPSRSSRPDDRR